jgi:tRNA nucleotidyltransferase (CCA-adding enzyme)
MSMSFGVAAARLDPWRLVAAHVSQQHLGFVFNYYRARCTVPSPAAFIALQRKGECGFLIIPMHDKIVGTMSGSAASRSSVRSDER